MYSVESFMVPAPEDFPWVMAAERVWDLDLTYPDSSHTLSPPNPAPP